VTNSHTTFNVNLIPEIVVPIGVVSIVTTISFIIWWRKRKIRQYNSTYSFNRDLITQPIPKSTIDIIQNQENSNGKCEKILTEEACVICYCNSKECLLLRCGHLGFCFECASKLKGHPCPICRIIVEDIVRAFRV